MFDVSYEEHGDVIVITIIGEFFIERVAYIEKIWNTIIAKKPRVVGLNCKGIKFIDSSAIGVLVKFLNHAMKQKIEFVFFDLSETVISIFRTAKLANFFTVMNKEQFYDTYLF